MAQPTITPEQRDRILSLMQKLLLKTHEASFEYSTLDCKDLATCPLAQKNKEIFKVVKELTQLIREMTPPESTPYVR